MLFLLALLAGLVWAFLRGWRMSPVDTSRPVPSTVVRPAGPSNAPPGSVPSPVVPRDPPRPVVPSNVLVPVLPRSNAPAPPVVAVTSAPPVVLSTQVFRVPVPTMPPAPGTVAPVPVPMAAVSNAPAGWVPRGPTNLLEAQIALAGLGLSPGSIDGVGGAQTAAALWAFQTRQGLEPTGALDRETRRALVLRRAPLATYRVRAEDLLGLGPVPDSWLGKSQAAALDHESLLERLAERFQAHPAWLRRLNPGLDWERVAEAQDLVVPSPSQVAARRAALIRIHLGGRFLRVYDAAGELMAHFPCSIARRVEKRPVGELQVVVTVPNPDYTWDPEVFPESPEARTVGRKLRLPPGPNNPVGVAWIGLNRPGYGIHGTPRPEEVGRTESHGCFRLANWNADLLLRMAWPGLPVRVEAPTPPGASVVTSAAGLTNVAPAAAPAPSTQALRSTPSGTSRPSEVPERPVPGPVPGGLPGAK